jgi:hypothetical protein
MECGQCELVEHVALASLFVVACVISGTNTKVVCRKKAKVDKSVEILRVTMEKEGRYIEAPNQPPSSYSQNSPSLFLGTSQNLEFF